MSQSNRRLKVSSKTPVGAGVAGASGGTGLLALVHAIPDGSPLKAVIMFATPSISLAISAIWIFLMGRLDSWLAVRSMQDELTRAEQALHKIENDPRASDKIKKDARSNVEALRLTEIEYHSHRMRVIVDS